MRKNPISTLFFMLILASFDVAHFCLAEEPTDKNPESQRLPPRLIPSPKTAHEKFQNFNELRGYAKGFKLVWGIPDLKKYNNASMRPWHPNEADEIYERKEHVVTDENEIERWRLAVIAPVIKEYHSTAIGMGMGTTTLPHDVNGIIVETNHGEVYIGITKFAFHVGHWPGRHPTQKFYSPSLATILKEYTEKMKLEGYPDWSYKTLSGEIMLSDIDWVKTRIEPEAEYPGANDEPTQPASSD